MTGSTKTITAPHWLDEREHAAWRAFLAMHAQLDARLAAELKRDANLSGAAYAVLVGVSEAPSRRIRPRELGQILGWEKSRLSKQVSRMEQRGLVNRESCPTDARGWFLVLTDLGRETIEAAAPEHAEQVRRWFVDPLTTEQLEQLTAISTAILEPLDAGPATP